ncbi:hypothetical protein L1049_017521 [Liquidambar formosana]|uniref:Uncharacterized protein n=1 Tax=Liquidambar formosana TaxID=63359 RepID=A0AAP0S1C2_LIQFO
MGLSILQVPRSRIYLMPSLQSTSLGSFWLRNFYALRNALASGSTSKLLGASSSESSRRGANRTWILRLITTATEQRTIDTEISQNRKLEHELLDGKLTERRSKSVLNCFKSIQLCDPSPKDSGEPRHKASCKSVCY